MKKVHIGIQARSTSTRLPNKVMKFINGKTVLEHVIAQVESSINYINKHSHRNNIEARLFLLVPHGDPLLKERIHANSKTGHIVLQGPEHDVLTRYVDLQREFGADVICRITSDCPLIPSAVITKAIIIACTDVNGSPRDFVSNASPECRTFFDGADCEVFNKRTLQWLDQHAEGVDREHVTKLLYEKAPFWLRAAHIFSVVDTSRIKLSIDTEEDLALVRENYNEVERKIKAWGDKYGKENCHRF